MEFLQHLFKKNTTATEEFLHNFPHAIHQALALPLARPEMLWANITRSVYTLTAAGVEMALIVYLMNLRRDRLLAVMGGMLVVTPIVEVEPEDFDFEGNTHDGV